MIKSQLLYRQLSLLFTYLCFAMQKKMQPAEGCSDKTALAFCHSYIMQAPRVDQDFKILLAIHYNRQLVFELPER